MQTRGGHMGRAQVTSFEHPQHPRNDAEVIDRVPRWMQGPGCRHRSGNKKGGTLSSTAFLFPCCFVNRLVLLRKVVPAIESDGNWPSGFRAGNRSDARIFMVSRTSTPFAADPGQAQQPHAQKKHAGRLGNRGRSRIPVNIFDGRLHHGLAGEFIDADILQGD
jgi:hypothetical protein